MSDSTQQAKKEVAVTNDTGRAAGPFGELRQHLSQGDIGSLPVILGLIVIAIIFQLANPNFLSPLNLTNLMVQISSMGTMSVGIVLVLLIAEIDLSVGAVSGLCAGVMAVLSVNYHLPGIVAILAGLAAGAAIGLLQGWWFAKIHVPSFVVTLAGFIGWTGALLLVLGATGTINLNDKLIVGLVNTLLPVWLGWAIAIVFVLGYIISALGERRNRSRLNLSISSMGMFIARIVIISAAILAAVAMMSINRNPGRKIAIEGVPMAVIFLLIFIVLFDFILRRTKFGRYVFAVGGNAEAARRAGINVDGIRIIVFVLCSTLAAAGGVLAASRLYAVNQSSGSGDVLLNAIAAAVIGGTSLFGGRGNTWSALLGALVIGSIANGMDLLALASSIRFMVTGAVLLLAVTLDAYTRSRRETTGR